MWLSGAGAHIVRARASEEGSEDVQGNRTGGYRNAKSLECNTFGVLKPGGSMARSVTYFKIPPENQGPRPTAYEPFERTRNALLLAQECSSSLPGICFEHPVNKQAYEKTWSHFVIAYQQFWVLLVKEGEKLLPQFSKWYREIEKCRKENGGLLEYLYESRSQALHGFVAIQWVPAIRLGSPSGGMTIHSDVTIKTAPPDNIEVSSETFILGGPPQDDVTSYLSEAPVLPDIYNRKSKITYPPPTSHCGKALVESSPDGVAWLAVHYAEYVFNQALGLFNVNRS